MLRAEGTQILNETGVFQIKGVSMIDIGAIGTEYQRRIDTAIKFLKINTIRFPVYPPVVPDRVSSYPFVPGGDLIKNNLIPMIEYAQANDLEVIVDWHQIADMSEATVESALDFWREAIPKLEEYDNVSYEIYNEPINSNTQNPWESTGPETWAVCKPHIQKLVDEIRKLTNKMLIVPTPVYCRHPAAAVVDPIAGENIAYSIHLYTPDVWAREGLYEFLRGVRWANGVELPPQFTTIEDNHKAFNIAMIDQIRAITTVPFVITELGLNVDVEDFMTPFNQLIADRPDMNIVAWVYDRYWWPPLIKENEALTPFGRKIKSMFK